MNYQLYSLGIKSLEENNYECAEELFLESLNEKSSRVDNFFLEDLSNLYYNLGLSQYYQEKVNEAINSFYSSLECCMNENAVIMESLSYGKINKFNEAISILLEGYILFYNNNILLSLLGLFHKKIEKYDEALIYYCEAEIIIGIEIENQLDIIFCLKKIGLYDDAICRLKKLIELKIKDKRLYIELGHCYILISEYGCALKIYKKANRLWKDDLFLYQVAVCYQQQCDYSKAIDILLNINNREFQVLCDIVLGECYASLGDYFIANKYFQEVIKVESSSEVYFRIGYALKELDPYVAKDYFIRSVQLNSSIDLLSIQFIRILGDPKKAIQILFSCLHHYVDQLGNMYYEISKCYWDIHCYYLSEIFINKALQVEYSYKNLLMKGRILYAKGDTDLGKLCQIFKKAFHIKSDGVDSLYYLGYLGENIFVIDNLLKLFEIFKNDISYLKELSWNYIQLGEHELSIKYLYRAYCLDKEDKDICYLIAICKIKQKKVSNAKMFLYKAISVDSRDLKSLHALYEVLDYEKIIEVVTHNEFINSCDREQILLKGWSLYKLERYNDLYEYIKTFKGEIIQNEEFLWLYSKLLLKQMHYKRAIHVYKKLIHNDDYSYLVYDIGYLYERLEQYKSAIRYYKRASSLNIRKALTHELYCYKKLMLKEKRDYGNSILSILRRGYNEKVLSFYLEYADANLYGYWNCKIDIKKGLSILNEALAMNYDCENILIMLCKLYQDPYLNLYDCKKSDLYLKKALAIQKSKDIIDRTSITSYLAHCYIKGIGVTKSVFNARNYISENILFRNIHSDTILLYAFLSLKSKKNTSVLNNCYKMLDKLKKEGITNPMVYFYLSKINLIEGNITEYADNYEYFCLFQMNSSKSFEIKEYIDANLSYLIYPYCTYEKETANIY